ncbi:hypothetical protein ACSMXM_05570 [Pacificimonas sp. ICDLI1SI03]
MSASGFILLPWPPRELSPNSRKDRRWTTDIRTKFKSDCYLATKAANPSVHDDGPIALDITFRPPDNRKRDRDNMLSSTKYGLDSMAAAMGIDDSLFEPITIRLGSKVNGGAVEVRLA